MRIQSFLAAIALCSYAHALTSTNAQVSRQDMMKTMGGVAAGWMLTSVSSGAETTAAGVKYEVIKAGTGPKPDVGQLVAIRFNAFAGDNKIDDIFDTPEPYYTRLGSGGLLKGVETTLPLMVLGDRWKLTIPVRLDTNSRL
jgi:FKBP-type peptidyl-prolyl cis-trans isomerase